MIDETIEKIWERWSEDRSEPYKWVFFENCREHGELMAIYNLGVNVGWQLREEQASVPPMGPIDAT